MRPKQAYRRIIRRPCFGSTGCHQPVARNGWVQGWRWLGAGPSTGCHRSTSGLADKTTTYRHLAAARDPRANPQAGILRPPGNFAAARDPRAAPRADILRPPGPLAAARDPRAIPWAGRTHPRSHGQRIASALRVSLYESGCVHSCACLCMRCAFHCMRAVYRACLCMGAGA